MTDLFKVFNVTSQKEFDNLMEKMDIDMFSTSSIFEIIESNDDIDTCRKNILENVAINDYKNYDLLKEQFNKKPFVRTLKENELDNESKMIIESFLKESNFDVIRVRNWVRQSNSAKWLKTVLGYINTIIKDSNDFEEIKKLEVMKKIAMSKYKLAKLHELPKEEIDESMDCQEEEVITMIPEEIEELEPSIKQEQPQKVYNITINYNKEAKVCESSLYQNYNQCVKNNGKLIEEYISAKVNKVIDEWVNNEYEPLINVYTMHDKMKIIEHNDKSGKYIEKIINILSEYE